MEKDQNIEEKQRNAPPPAQGREQLPMEKKFNQWAYGGISYFAQAFTGSALAYWNKFGGGRPIYDKMAHWLGPNFISKVTHLRGAEAVKGADTFITISTMVMMGNLFLIPLKWMENKKAAIVEKWTNQDNAKREASGEVIAPEEKAHQQELLDQLKSAPKQNWWSLGLGRAFSLATVYGVYFGLGEERNKRAEQFTSGLLKKGANAVGFKKLATSNTVSNVLNIGFVEVLYSMISAGGLFVYSHFVVPPKDKAQGDPITKEFIAPDTSMEETPPKKSPVSQTRRYVREDKHTNFVDSVFASQQTPTNLQVAL